MPLLVDGSNVLLDGSDQLIDGVTISSPAAINVVENTTAVGMLTADDPDSGTVTWAISGGDDELLFSLDENSGELAFLVAPDYEAPDDADSDNVYEIEVTASSTSGFEDVQSIAITVTDVSDNASGSSRSSLGIGIGIGI